MFGDIIEELREGLAVSAEHDASILRGIRQAARQLLKIYNFPKSVRRAVLPILGSEDSVDLPADLGKVKQVWLTTVENGVKLYKTLKRREEGQLPVYAGPSFYFTEGSKLLLDQPMPAIIATTYNIEIWYQSNDPDINESWLSTEFQDAIEHLAGVKLSLKKRKEEAAKIYSSLWQQDTVILARYVAELEFSEMDMGMGESSTVALERYPA